FDRLHLCPDLGIGGRARPDDVAQYDEAQQASDDRRNRTPEFHWVFHRAMGPPGQDHHVLFRIVNHGGNLMFKLVPSRQRPWLRRGMRCVFLHPAHLMPARPGVAQPDNPSKLKSSGIIVFRPLRGQAEPLGQEPRALFVSPLFFGAARGSRKALTPGTLRFPCVFHYFTSQSHENHDFYPTPPLHGVSIAMYTRALVEETSRLCGSQPRSL